MINETLTLAFIFLDEKKGKKKPVAVFQCCSFQRKLNNLSVFEEAGEMATKPSISPFKLAGCGVKY